MADMFFGKTKRGVELKLLESMANRHGLIAGATGTGKTVSLQRLAENFSAAGIPVFMADIKGDLSGLAAAGDMSNPRVAARLQEIAVADHRAAGSPVLFWDIYGKTGHPIRTTVSEMGPLLIARLLDLNDTQQEVLEATFRIADSKGLLLLDLKDLKEMLSWVSENSAELKNDYGNLSPQTVAAIQRQLASLADAGGTSFFGEPALQLADIMQRDFSGRGVISILDASQVVNDGRVYSTLLLWLLSELFEELPEIGDQAVPKLAFFFDEAHLLFNEAPKSLVQKIEQVVRLIRSKGVGVYFITQNPLDIPDAVAAQLGNRVQHALRAFTPKEQKVAKVAAESFRANPELEPTQLITQLGVGEALVSFLDSKGMPIAVEHVLVCPPTSRIGVLTPGERSDIIGRSPIKGRYDNILDRESAAEMLKKKVESATSSSGGFWGGIKGLLGGGGGSTSRRQGVGEAMVKSVVRSVGAAVGREIMRGVLGSRGRR